MAETKLFRTSIVGGYNKADVMEYVGKLEKELEELKKVKEKAQTLEKSVSHLLDKQEENSFLRNIKEELEKEEAELSEKFSVEDYEGDGLSELQEKAKKYDESYDAIRKLLLDSRIEAQVILTDAKQKAENIVKEAEHKAYYKQKEMEQKILSDAQKKAAQIVLNAEIEAKERSENVNSTIALEVKESAGKIQEEFRTIQMSMQYYIDTLPTRLEKCVKERISLENASEKSSVLEDRMNDRATSARTD